MKDFSTKYTVRTDLADEAREYWREKNGSEPDGLDYSSKQINGVKVDTLLVKDKNGEKMTGKPCGRYVTVDIGKIWSSDSKTFDNACHAVADAVRSFIPDDGSCMLAALGNRNIIADATGPCTAENFIVTRHIRQSDEELFKSFDLRETICITPGVLGSTGVEAAEIIRGAVKSTSPSFVIAVDSLASRKLSRLATTVQICDTGISPGSGINNTRKALTSKTLGVPVIAIGIPTVVEATTLALDIISDAVEKSGDSSLKNVGEMLSENPSGFFVTPKDTDHIIKDTSKLVGYAINLALHNDLTMEEIDEFLS